MATVDQIVRRNDHFFGPFQLRETQILVDEVPLDPLGRGGIELADDLAGRRGDLGIEVEDFDKL